MLETAEVMEDMEDQEEVMVDMEEDMVDPEVMEALEGLEAPAATLGASARALEALAQDGPKQLGQRSLGQADYLKIKWPWTPPTIGTAARKEEMRGASS